VREVRRGTGGAPVSDGDDEVGAVEP
jgi:hypothetical protein